MRLYWTVGGMVLVFPLVLFLLVEALGIPLLDDPTPWLGHGGTLAAAVGVLLLTVDVLLPVPSNVVMIAHGALFGVAVGTMLSMIGSMIATVAAFWIGRRGGRLLALVVGPGERDRGDAVFQRWGTLAIVVSRPLPLLSEAVVVLAGTSRLGWRPAMTAAALGWLPPCLFYAWAGASSIGVEGGAIVSGLVVLLAVVVGLVVRTLEGCQPGSERPLQEHPVPGRSLAD
ncbi:MAG: VTT domain-containing protein [Chloroflexi bacterium]|nr:VTT domain-containing protein [Chloroflexota bacterium]